MEARDFEDVWVLPQQYPTAKLLEWAAEGDDGFDPAMFEESVAAIDRYPDRAFNVDGPAVAAMRQFFSDLRLQRKPAAEPPTPAPRHVGTRSEFDGLGR